MFSSLTVKTEIKTCDSYVLLTENSVFPAKNIALIMKMSIIEENENNENTIDSNFRKSQTMDTMLGPLGCN